MKGGGARRTSALDCRESRTGMETPGVPELFFRMDVVSIEIGLGKRRCGSLLRVRRWEEREKIEAGRTPSTGSPVALVSMCWTP